MDNIVLVAGFNYHSLKPGFVPFSPRQITRNRCAEIFAASPRNQAVRLCQGRIRVILVDVESGTVSAVEQNAVGEIQERVISQYGPISPENYKWVDPGRWLFCQEGERVLSILDVYDLLKDLGRREPRTVRELSFVSHGWAGGPSLVNSDDRIDRGRIGPASDDEPRDPLDKDGRRFKDFKPPTTLPSDLELMRRAFAADSYVWNWSCNNSTASADVVAQIVQSAPSVLNGSIDPERNIEFRFTVEQQDAYFNVDRCFFPLADLIFRRSIAEATTFLWKRMLSTYSGQAALALGRPCFGPLPGMPSDIERDGTFPQLVVPHTPEYSANRSGELCFYERYMGVSFDSEGRRYGAYRPHELSACANRLTGEASLG